MRAWVTLTLSLPAVRGVFGILLVLCASRIGHLFYPRGNEPDGTSESKSLGPGHVYRIGSFLLGVCVLVQAVRPAALTVVALMSAKSGVYVQWQDHVSEAVEASVLILIAMGLIFGSRGLARLFESLRYDPDDIPTQQFTIRLLLFVILVVAVMLGLIKYLVS